MSSIGLAISSFFTGKAATPEKQTPQKEDSEELEYTNIEDQ